MNSLSIQHLTFKYPHQPSILKDINATFHAGTLSLITGPSGAGKSTLLKLIARLIPKPNNGQIIFGKVALEEIPKQQLSNYVTLMFQDPNRQFAMRTVKHELIFTLENRQVPANHIASTIQQILSSNHLVHLKNRQLNTLSGGEKQRVALAIIKALNSKLILLDEPFTNVDQKSRRQIMKQLAALKNHGKIIVIVDHDLQDYVQITDQLLIMKNGQLYPAKFSQFSPEPLNYHWKLPKSKSKPLYQLTDLRVGYRRPLIKVHNFNFYANYATLITGPNGSGKSTLFRALLKLIKYQGGISYKGQTLTRLKKRPYYHQINLVFQEPTNQFLEITVKQELHLSSKSSRNPAYARQILQHGLKVTHLDQQLNQVIYSLSGGQQRSLQLIEALLSSAPVILMDEPFQSLDHHLIHFFKDQLRTAVTQHHRTLIIISHQIAPVADLFDYHVQLKNGRLHYLRGLN